MKRIKPLNIGQDIGVKQLEVELSKGSTGWILIHIGVDGMITTLKTSYWFPPFDDLLEFLKDVAVGIFPSTCEIDEEGETKVMIAEKHQDTRLFQFQLIDFYQYEKYMDNVFPRELFVLSFYFALVAFDREEFDKGGWRGSLFHSNIEPLTKIVNEIIAKGI